MKRRRKGKPVPLAPPPMMRSRKRARVVTTLFHKHTEKRDAALRAGDVAAAKHHERLIEDMGGRAEYQRASQLNTSLHSTSRWVLTSLRKMGWLQEVGRLSKKSTETAEVNKICKQEDLSNVSKFTAESCDKFPQGGRNFQNLGRKQEGLSLAEHNPQIARLSSETKCNGTADSNYDPHDEQLQLLEVGAINTELIRASEKNPHKLSVRAIDLLSTNEQIEKCDFFKLPLRHSDPNKRYHVVVCSMVINCVTAPSSRGRMMLLLLDHLRPGGLCFLTLPLRCLTESKYMTREMFLDLLSGPVGFEIVETKETPKLAFFILRRPRVHELGNSLVYSSEKKGAGEETHDTKSAFDEIADAEHVHEPKMKVEDHHNEGKFASITNKWTKVVTVAKGKKFKNTFAVVLGSHR